MWHGWTRSRRAQAIASRSPAKTWRSSMSMGAIYAMEDSCLHKGASLGTGQLDGKVVTCRSHGWRYDVTTGSTMNVPGYGVASYPAKVVDGKILVAVA